MKIGLFDHARDDRPILAIALLLIATFSLGLQDALMKLMSHETSFWQIQTLRSIGNLCFTVLLASFGGGLLLIRPRNYKGVYLRALFLSVCMFFFFSGAPFLSVSQMATGLYTYPLFVCLMAGPVLGEQIGPWRIFAVILGAVGAMLVLSPWKASFTPVQILPVVAGFFFACNVMTLRRACRYESTLALAFATGLVFLASGLIGVTLLTWITMPVPWQQQMPYIAVGWPALTWLVVSFAVLASVLNLTGNICMTRAYQTADASLLAPLDFSYLIFAAFWGKVLFNDWPDETTLTGMLLIVCAGIVIAYREQLGRQSLNKRQTND